MSYTNDSKPSGSNTNDSNLTVVQWNDSHYAWDSALVNWDNSSPYSADSKPSGSYANDTKPT